jgi:seryl-tRNA synthetase
VSEYGGNLRKINSINNKSYYWHDEIAAMNGWSDLEAAGRMSGTRFNILYGSLSRLERELTRYFLDFHSKNRNTNINNDNNNGDGGGGYTEVSVPVMVSRETLEGTGHLPKFELDLFKIKDFEINHGQETFLIPTAEVPVTSIFRHQIIDSNNLPIKYVCHSTSFRAEAGSYGIDTRGFLRQHHFQKVELVAVTMPEDSERLHNEMVSDVEMLLQSLKLPYRVVLLCSGDTGN